MSLDHNTQSHNDDKEPAIETSLQGQQNQGGRVVGGVINSPPPNSEDLKSKPFLSNYHSVN